MTMIIKLLFNSFIIVNCLVNYFNNSFIKHWIGTYLINSFRCLPACWQPWRAINIRNISLVPYKQNSFNLYRLNTFLNHTLPVNVWLMVKRKTKYQYCLLSPNIYWCERGQRNNPSSKWRNYDHHKQNVYVVHTDTIILYLKYHQDPAIS